VLQKRGTFGYLEFAPGWGVFCRRSFQMAKRHFDPGGGAWTPKTLGSIGQVMAAHTAYLMTADGSKAEREAKLRRKELLQKLGADGRRVLGLVCASLECLAGR
jgi:hypothetical protein